MSLKALLEEPNRLRSASEAARELGVPPEVLALWERRLGDLAPLRDARGERLYRPQDMALLRQIRFRLYVEGYTITGVSRLLETNRLAEATAGRSLAHHRMERGSMTPKTAMLHRPAANGDPPGHGGDAGLRPGDPRALQATAAQAAAAGVFDGGDADQARVRLREVLVRLQAARADLHRALAADEPAARRSVG